MRDGMNSCSGYIYAFFLILFVLGMISFPAAAAGDQLKDAGQRWAVIVGISDYQNLGDLDNAVNDALDMKSVLINKCNFAPDHVYTYTNGQASKGSIQNALNLMSARAGPSDVVVFYFSGHGDQMDRDLSPYDEADGRDEVLCPYDSYSDRYDRDISDDELQTMLGRINSKNTICIFDTCHSGGMVKGSRISAIYGASKDSPAIDAFVRNDGISADFSKDARSGRYVMLMASDDDESAVDSSRLQNGVFTYYLVEGLTSTSANLDSDQYISIEEAFSYAQAASTRYDSSMHPQIYDGDRYTEIEFASLSATPTPTATQSTPAVDISGKTVQGYLSAGQSAYYSFDIPSGVSFSSCTVTLAGPSGSDFDLYIRKGATPTKDNYDYRGYTATANEQVSISSPSSGRYYVMVQAYSGSGSYSLAETHAGTSTPTPTITRTVSPTVTPTPTGTQSTVATVITGRTVTGYISSGQSQYYYFDISAIQSGRPCTITLDGPSGADFDLYVRKGSNPTADNYDYRGYTASADEEVSISSPTTGRYYVMVNAYSGSGSYTISETTGGSSTQTVTPTPTITRTVSPTVTPTPTITRTISPTVTQNPGGTDITARTVQGSISSGQSYYYFDIPTGSAVSSCIVVLDGPSGADYDLFVKRGSNPSTWIYDYRSSGRTADESVTINNPSAGRYYVMVKYYNGPGSFTIRETHGAGTTVTPTLTITRTVSPTVTPTPTGTQSTVATAITGKTVTGFISTGQSQYYYFDISAIQSGRPCTITLDGPSGADFDLYVRKGSNPTTDNYDYRGYTASADEEVSISSPTTGRYYVMVNAHSGSGSFTITETTGGSSTQTVTPTPTITRTVSPTSTPLPTVTPGTSGTDITVKTVTGFISTGQSQYYYFDISAIQSGRPCTITLDGPSGADFDLYVRKGSNPTADNYDYRGYTASADEQVSVSSPTTGRYYVMVNAYSGSGSYTISETTGGSSTLTVTPTPTITRTVSPAVTPSPTVTQTLDGSDITGRTVQGYISSGQSYYYFDIPSGSAVSSCTVVLDGPAGADYDLFVKRGSNPGTWIYDYRSAGRTADESITINNPSAGRYYVMVMFYSGPGSYTLRETHSGVVSQATLPTVTGTYAIPTTVPPATVPITVSPTFTQTPADGNGYGSIAVTSGPTSAWVYLDGIPARKITPSTLIVTAGTHTVGCRKTGYPEQVRTVTVGSGMTADVHFTL
jgi:uncharacterized caspase-like protein